MRAVNLIPAEQRGGASVGAGESQGGAYALLALVAGIAVLAALYGAARHQVASTKAQAVTVTGEAQRAQAAAQSLAPYTSFIAMREQRLQAVATLVNSRFDWAHVFHEFGRVLPPGISISALDGTVGTTSTTGGSGAGSAGAGTSSSAPVASSTPPGSLPVFTLTGCASSQQQVALMLERLRLMDGAGSVTLQSSTKGGGSSGTGTCPPTAPVFTAQITFAPLPTSSAKIKTTATVAATSTPATGSATTSTSGASAR